MEQTEIIGTKVNKVSTREVLENIKSFLLSGRQHHIVTLNPEMVIEAQKDNCFKNIINKSDLSIADGIGIVFANMFLSNELSLERIHGIDLVHRICEDGLIKNKRIYLLGAGKGVAVLAAEKLQNQYPHLHIAGAEEGIPEKIANCKFQTTNEDKKAELNTQDSASYEDLNQKLIERINCVKPDILLVAFGAPRQEKWINENLKKIPSVRLAIGVGGSFDFISGKVKRAPLFIRRLKMEWLWRLIQEPKRAKRIYNATIKFSWLIIKDKLK